MSINRDRMTPILQSLCAPPPFELWLIDLDRDDDQGASALSLLDERERARAARFAFERDRRRYVAAHRGLRELLSARTGISADRLRFAEGEFGKPHLVGTSPWAFSLSHSEHYALVALACDGEIGVDIEMLRDLPDLDDLARRCFTVDERRELDAAPPAQRGRLFLRGWTRKEACLKALGTGLQIEPAAFSVGLQPGGPREVCIDSPDGRLGLLVQSIEPEAAFVSAVARATGVPPKRNVGSAP